MFFHEGGGALLVAHEGVVEGDAAADEACDPVAGDEVGHGEGQRGEVKAAGEKPLADFAVVEVAEWREEGQDHGGGGVRHTRVRGI